MYKRKTKWNFREMKLEYLADSVPLCLTWFKQKHPEVPRCTVNKNTKGWAKEYSFLKERIEEAAQRRMIERGSNAIARAKERQITIGSALQELAFKNLIQEEKQPDGTIKYYFLMKPRSVTEAARAAKIGSEMENLALGTATERVELAGPAQDAVTLEQLRQAHNGKEK